MLFSQIVATSRDVGATRSRKVKIGALREVLTQLEPAEVEPVVAWLSGELRQGRIGIGWRTIADIPATPADVPSVTVSELDGTVTAVAAISGSGSAARRRELLADLFARTTADERDFLLRLLTGDLRQGALEGVMTDAIAAAADLPVEPVRRAFMLSGRLPATAVA
ncbi:ATP-dependent DNA ligase, partial [Rhodococcus wratislaviensis IFP 2016]